MWQVLKKVGTVARYYLLLKIDLILIRVIFLILFSFFGCIMTVTFPPPRPLMKRNPPFSTVVADDEDHLWSLIHECVVYSPDGLRSDLNFIDVSRVANMSRLFADGLQLFNGDISQWDVSRVTDMSEMFCACEFNGDISKWNVSEVTNMSGLFSHSRFNGDISQWDVSKVEDMYRMFWGSQFNGDVSLWDVSNVGRIQAMFSYSQFNGDISKWNIDSALKFHRGKVRIVQFEPYYLKEYQQLCIERAALLQVACGFYLKNDSQSGGLRVL